MPNTDQRLYDFLEDAHANVLQGNPIEALRAIALDALLLAQDIEHAQKRLDSDEGQFYSWRDIDDYFDMGMVNRWCAVCGKKTEGPHTLKFVLGGRALVCKSHGLARSAQNLLRGKK